MAGSLWAQPRVKFRPAFVESGKKFYSFQAVSALSGGPIDVDAINKWVAKHTCGVLTHVLDTWQDGDFFILDTTTFKEAWESPFEASLTKPKAFTLFSGKKKQVQ